MPRYTINQTYTSPRELTPDEQVALVRAVEAAALEYLRRATEPAWRQWSRRFMTQIRALPGGADERHG